jgi:glutamine amidotransferase
VKVVIVKYNAGNIYSVQLALERLGVKPRISDDPLLLQRADKIIFPGVGEASSAMGYLTDRKLDRVIIQLRQPVLGICLGLQLLCRYSEENATSGLGIFPVNVMKFPAGYKVPHMGWNTVSSLKGPLFNGVPENSYVYFVHSFYAEAHPAAAAITDYIFPFSAALRQDNFYAVQFHPEKSGKVGELILKNFLDL